MIVPLAMRASSPRSAKKQVLQELRAAHGAERPQQCPENRLPEERTVRPDAQVADVIYQERELPPQRLGGLRVGAPVALQGDPHHLHFGESDGAPTGCCRMQSQPQE